MEFLLAACRLQLVERDKFRDLMEIRLDKQQKNIEIENKKGEVGKWTPNYSKRHELDNSVAEKTWKDMDAALLGNVERPSVKSESAVNEIKEEIKLEIKTEIDPEEKFQCGKCGKYSPSEISLGIHMRKAHNESTEVEKRKQMFSCKFCTKSYPLKHQMGMHMKKQHSKPPQNTKTSKMKRVNGPKHEADRDEASETDEIQKCLMELSEDEDDGVETKVSQDEQNSKQIIMDVDKLISETSENKGHNEEQLFSFKEKDTSLRPKKDTVEHLMTQLTESKYFKSQKNQVFFECPSKEADTFVQLDLIPGWRSKMSKVKSLASF